MVVDDAHGPIGRPLHHTSWPPGATTVYDSGSFGGQFYYAMELVRGRHLDRYVREMKLERRQILSLMRDVCLAVQHAHQHGVLHRDLKPANILVMDDGVPKVRISAWPRRWARAAPRPVRTRRSRRKGTSPALTRSGL